MDQETDDPNGAETLGITPSSWAEDRFARVFEASPTALVLVGRAGRIEMVNRQAEQMFGYDRAELRGQRMEILMPARFRGAHPALRERFMGNMSSRTMGKGQALFGLRKDGSEFPLEIGLNPLGDGDNTAVLAGIIDITARRQDELDKQQRQEELEESEAKYRRLAEHSTDMIVVTDRQLVRRYTSRGCLALLGYQPEELVGDTGLANIHPDDQKRVETSLRLLMAGGDHDRDRISYRMLHRDGRPVWVDSVKWVSAYAADGLPVEVCGAIRDISEIVATREILAAQRDELQRVNAENEREIEAHRQTEAALTVAKNIAEQASRAKSRFVALVSHELRTPLNGILGYAQLLKMEGGLSRHQTERVAAMTAAGRHLLELIERVLDFSALDANRIELRPAHTTVQDLAEECLNLVEPAAEEKCLNLRLLMARRAPRWAMVDVARFRQVIVNLLGNAVKFTNEGSVELRLLATMDGGLRIEVADTGRGIPPGTEGRLFQEFERLSPVSTCEGAGLGLAISMGFIRLMGGTIGYSPNPSGGSIFWVELPASATTVEKPPTIAPERTPVGDSMQGDVALRILIVDDMAMNRDVLGSMLGAAGHRFESAVNGELAAKIAGEQDFDLILMDVRMPVMDGLEATKCIRALPGRRGKVPIIALTAHAFAEQIAKCQEAGMSGHITKPVDCQALLQAIRDLANRSQPASAEEPAEPPDFGQDILGDVAQFMDAADLATHLAGLSRSIEAMLAAISHWEADPGQAEAAIDAAHTIAGSAGTFGFTRLSDRARHFERALTTMDPDPRMPRDALRSDARWVLDRLATRNADKDMAA